jgi:hypothetical protein
MLTDWTFYIPSAVIVGGFVVYGKWLVSISKRVRDQAERISYLEGKQNDRDNERSGPGSG